MVLAARHYLACRLRLMGADAGEMLTRTCELDDAYHALVVACGLRCEDVGCWHDDPAELPGPVVKDVEMGQQRLL